MPELPEVEALAHHLRETALYRPVARVDVASMSVLKTPRHFAKMVRPKPIALLPNRVH